MPYARRLVLARTSLPSTHTVFPCWCPAAFLRCYQCRRLCGWPRTSRSSFSRWCSASSNCPGRAPAWGARRLWLYADDRIRIACALAEQRGRFLFEVRPDAFPCGRLTDLEEQGGRCTTTSAGADSQSGSHGPPRCARYPDHHPTAMRGDHDRAPAEHGINGATGGRRS